MYFSNSATVTLLASVSVVLAISDQIIFDRASTASKSNPPLLRSDFDAFVEPLLAEWGVPGVSVGVLKLGDKDDPPTVEFRSYGTMGNGRNVTEDTLFGIASNSKAFTAASVGVLVERGLVNWTSKVSEVLPQFGLMDDVASSHASVIDILSHQTGMPRHDYSNHVGETHEDLVKRIRYLRPSTELRESWQYNNQMFNAAAFLVSQLSGSPFTDFVTSNIIKPLNMTSTTYTPVTDGVLDKVSASFISLPNNSVVEIPYDLDFDFEGIQTAAGAAGIVSSARDLMKWLEFLLTQKRASTGERTRFSEIVSTETVHEMTKSHSVSSRETDFPDSSIITYGLGLAKLYYQGHEVIHHGGALPGFGTQISWSPFDGIGIVALCNTARTGNSLSDIVSFRAFEDVAGLPHVDWNSRYQQKRTNLQNRLDQALKEAQDAETAQGTEHESKAEVPIERFYGLYTDRGYGDIIICASSNTKTYHSSTRGTSTACEAFHERIVSAVPMTPFPTPKEGNSLTVILPAYFGISHVILFRPNESEPLSFKGVVGETFGPVPSRPRDVMGYDWDNQVRVDFLVESSGNVTGFQASGVWGPGEEVVKREEKEGHQVEVIFTRVRGEK